MRGTTKPTSFAGVLRRSMVPAPERAAFGNQEFSEAWDLGTRETGASSTSGTRVSTQMIIINH